MFKNLLESFHSLKDHHQVLLTVIITFSAICVSWGAEKLLERYLFPNRPAVGYVVALMGGLFALWLVKHFLLQEI